jgi:hypothetical protein
MPIRVRQRRDLVGELVVMLDAAPRPTVWHGPFAFWQHVVVQQFLAGQLNVARRAPNLVADIALRRTVGSNHGHATALICS